MLHILETAPPAGGNYTNYFFVAIIAIFYFMIRPQNKKKRTDEFPLNLKKGDDVITQGGIHGNIVSVSDSTVTLSVDGNTKIKVKNLFSLIHHYYKINFNAQGWNNWWHRIW